MTANRRPLWSVYVFLFLCLSICSFAQLRKEPCAAFYFNDGSVVDSKTGLKAKLYDAPFREDRFGNKNYAVYLSGNGDSHINLGTNKELKSTEGTISLWIKMEHPIFAGKGVLYNPVLITRCSANEDFNEAYVIYYMLESRKLLAAFVRDSTREVGMYTSEPFQRNTWKHLAVTYDSSYVALYLDGKLEQRLSKKFKTTFLEGDSVLVGYTGSTKNMRWWHGTVDDLEFFDYVLNDEEIASLYNAPNPNRSALIFQRVLIGLGIALIVLLLFLFINYRIKLALKREQQKNELQHTLLQTELRVNRALMNPHFVFNSLNALQNLILNQEIDKANDYLVKFSKMIRKLLESNMSDVITLAVETELLTRYMEIESLRFQEDIQFNIHIHPDINPLQTRIPVMMLQPFVENAIWHGLLMKKGEKILSITFEPKDNKYVLCTIEDNGVGKNNKKSSAIFDKASLATSFIEQRLATLNRLLGLKCELNIEFKPNQSGTLLKILLPIL